MSQITTNGQGESALGKLISEYQLVGDGFGMAHFRNLYEDESGKRVSVPTSRLFCIEGERKLGEHYPPQSVTFAKYKL
jgi:hypothetical protein